MQEMRVLAPTAILGYGFPKASLEAGLARDPHVIAVDGGSTDGGPSYLGLEPGGGGGQAAAFLDVMRRDTEPLLHAALDAEIPLIIGSAGFAGADLHLLGALSVVRNIAEESGRHFRLGIAHAEIDKAYVKAKLDAGAVKPLGPAPPLTESAVDDSVRIVGQMGVEPFLKLLDESAQVIVAGRANDASMFAALPLRHGFDRGLTNHMAKILECGAIAADPGSGSDAMLGTLHADHFLVEPVAAERRATTRSVAAHALYEQADPTRLTGPGGHVDLTHSRYDQADARTVRVSGSRFVEAPYSIKLEGSRRVGYRTIAICGIRDPAAEREIDTLLDATRQAAAEHFPDYSGPDHRLLFHVYGRDGVMGTLEPTPRTTGHELCVIIEAVAPDQAQATAMCGHARSVLVHMGFPGRISTAGNLAFPFSPLDIETGPVYEFSVYHIVDEPDPLRLFETEIVEI